jgi:hypothetical protein
MARSVPYSEHFSAQNPAKSAPPDDGLQEGQPLKKATIAVAVLVLAVLMVLPIVRFVNLSAGKPVTIDRTLSVDGSPMPPFPPKPPSVDAGTLVADGSPMPPFPPKPPSIDDVTLVADGSPMPPFPPKPPQAQVSA